MYYASLCTVRKISSLDDFNERSRLSARGALDHDKVPRFPLRVSFFLSFSLFSNSRTFPKDCILGPLTPKRAQRISSPAPSKGAFSLSLSFVSLVSSLRGGCLWSDVRRSRQRLPTIGIFATAAYLRYAGRAGCSVIGSATGRGIGLTRAI